MPVFGELLFNFFPHNYFYFQVSLNINQLLSLNITFKEINENQISKKLKNQL